MTISAAVASLPPRVDPLPMSPPARTAPPTGLTPPVGHWYDHRAVGVGAALVLAAVGTAVFTAGIATPWPWGDEGATYLALQRDWTQLLVLYRSPDAPNVPFYFLAKAWTTAVQALWPSVATLLSLRLLSAAAATLTAVTLYALVARRAGRLPGLFSGLVLISLPGFSRYAQEARTYAVLALAATVSWLLWDRWVQPRGVPTLVHGGPALPAVAERVTPRRALGVVGYAASVAALAVLHTFGLFQWPAQAVATLFTPGTARTRLRRIAWLAAAMGVAAAAALWQVLDTVRYGTGPTGVHRFRVVDPVTVLSQLAKGTSWSQDPAASVPILALLALGASALLVKEHRPFTVHLLIWLVVPLAGEVTLGALHTNLFRYRYWIALLPPLAGLAGVGLASLPVQLGRFVRRHRPLDRAGRAAAVLVGHALALGILVFQVGTTVPAQNEVRSPLGHGQDLGRALALLDTARSQDPRVTAVFTNAPLSGVFGALDPGLQARNPLLQVDPSATTVYTSPTSAAVAMRMLATDTTLFWLLPGERTTAHQVLRSWPRDLAGVRPHVLWIAPAGPGLTAAMLQTRPGP